MKQFLSALLTMGLFVAGLPLHACGCGCDAPNSQRDDSVRSCAQCCHDSHEPTSNESTPCGCEHCPTQLEMPPSGPASFQPATRCISPERFSVDALASKNLNCSHIGALNHEPNRCPGSNDPPIPIRLGHLLL